MSMTAFHFPTALKIKSYSLHSHPKRRVDSVILSPQLHSTVAVPTFSLESQVTFGCPPQTQSVGDTMLDSMAFAERIFWRQVSRSCSAL
jgi:hypothetical protein